MSKLVSLLLPTRGRVQKLITSLDSLEQTVHDPSRVELLVWADSDDEPTIEYVKNMKRRFDAHLVIGPRRNGYADLHTYYNKLCEISQGRFLFLWNDDATMLTVGWDAHLAQHDDGKLCYVRSYVNDTRGRDQGLFPIVHRSFYERLGHFSMSAHNDTYVNELFAPHQHLVRETGIVVRHHALEIADTTALEGKRMWPITKAMWGQPELENCLQADRVKLAELVKQQA